MHVVLKKYIIIYLFKENNRLCIFYRKGLYQGYLPEINEIFKGNIKEVIKLKIQIFFLSFRFKFKNTLYTFPIIILKKTEYLK